MLADFIVALKTKYKHQVKTFEDLVSTQHVAYKI